MNVTFLTSLSEAPFQVIYYLLIRLKGLLILQSAWRPVSCEKVLYNTLRIFLHDVLETRV